MLKAYLHPKKKPNDRHWYAYDVVFDGEIIVSDSRHPVGDAAVLAVETDSTFARALGPAGERERMGDR